MRRLLATLVLSLGLLSPAHGQDTTSGPLAELDARLGEALSQLERAEADRARAEAELDGLAGARAEAQRVVRDRARALYRMRRAGALPVTGGFGAMLTHLGHAARLERMLARDVASLDDLLRRGDVLTEEIARTARTAEEARARSAALENERRALEIAEVEAALGSSRFAGVVERAFGSGGTLTVRDTTTNDPGRAFEALEGTLLLPVASPRRIEDVARGDGPALALDAGAGATVRTVAAGRVAFSGRHSDYGRLVIVDHGGSWFTVYGGMATIRAAVGDELPAGGSLGTLDREPLLFQVRRGTRALSPRSWLGL